MTLDDTLLLQVRFYAKYINYAYCKLAFQFAGSQTLTKQFSLALGHSRGKPTVKREEGSAAKPRFSPQV